ncbi:tetratricopeptide repeat protein [Thermospira aquatica]|uniref:Tetratricopeptide repeat protein n=1 Tax=Thermospira aquatica TaxID=2828656 RepID=A0AAX3BGS0_9SPIR|nr:tetratricopeptide repeat protein [Thermospira aquatica]URA11214.1 tetratricopeptide repeat protein [Thermospira aquatica]
MEKKWILLFFLFLPFFALAQTKDVERFFLSGRAAYTDRAYTIAIRLFDRVLSLDPFGEYADDAAYYRALCYYEDERYQRAIQLFNQFLSFYPYSPYREHVAYLIVEANYSLRNWDKVIQQGTLFLRNYPKGEYIDDAHYLMGSVYLLQGKYGSAIEEFRSVIGMTNSPLREMAFYRIVLALFYDGNYRVAKEQAQRFLASYPRSPLFPQTQMVLAKCAFAEKRYPEAKSIILQLLSNAPPTIVAEGIYYRAMIDIEMQNYSMAINYLETLVKYERFGSTPNDYREDGLYKLALLYKMQKRYDEAKKVLEQLFKLTRNKEMQLKASLELASLAVLLSDYEYAKNAYIRLSSLDSAYLPLSKQKLGELAFLLGKFSEAESYFSEIVENYGDTPQFPDALYWRARSRIEQERYEEAVRDLDQFRKLFPTASRIEETIMYTGNSYASMKKWDDALYNYNYLLRNYPNSRFADSAYLAIAWVYLQRGLFPRAEETYLRMANSYPNSPRAALALYSLASLYYNQRRYGEALTNFEQVYRRYRTSSYAGESLIKAGWVYLRQERFRDLIRFYEGADTAYLSQEQKAAFYNLLGWAYFRESLYEEAIKNYERSSTTTTNLTTALENQLYIAKAYYNMEKYDAAIKTYETYIQQAMQANITQEVPVAYAEMAWCYLKKGEKATAESIYQQLLQEFPYSVATAEAVFRMGEIAFSSQKYDEAIQHYQRLLVLPPSEYQAAAYYWLGRTYLRLDKKLDAIRMFETYVSKYPRGDYLPDSLLQLGNLYFSLNNYEKARNAYNTLIGQFPKTPDAEMARVQLKELQMVQEAKGDPEKLYKIMVRESKTKEARSLALSKLARFYEENDKIKEAIQTYTEIESVGVFPDAARAALEIGNLLSQQKQYIQAIQAYSRILTKYEEESLYPEALYGIGAAYFSNEQWEFARRYLQQVVERYPNSPQSTLAKELLNRLPKND